MDLLFRPTGSWLAIENRVRNFYLFRWGALLFLAIAIIIDVSGAFSGLLEHSRLTMERGDVQTKLNEFDIQRRELSARSDLNSQEQAALKLQRGSPVESVVTKYFIGVPVMLWRFLKGGVSPMSEYQQYEIWRKSLPVREAQLRIQARQLQRDISSLEQRQAELLVRSDAIMREDQLYVSRRNWCSVFAVGAILISSLVFSCRPSEAVMEALFPAAPLLKSGSIPPPKQPTLPTHDCEESSEE